MPDITTAPQAEAELHRAVSELARADHSHDGARRRVIKRASTLGLSDRIPDNWQADGALKDTRGAWSTNEQRETYNDLYQGLSSAVDDKTEGDYYYTWVQDFTDTDVIYVAGGELWSAPYTLEPGGPITIGDPVKVRPLTTYVERDDAGGEREDRSNGAAPEGKRNGPLLEWRRSKAEDLRGHLEHREFSTIDLELREKDEDTWNLTGYASVTEQAYDVGFYSETIKRGAFKRTLGESPDVQLLVNHEGLPLARTRSGTLRLEERERGLWVDADLDKRDPDAQRLERKMARGDIDQMSFAFQATDQEWNADYTERTIKSLSIHRGDVSVVNQGANSASTATIRSAEAIRALQAAGADAVVEMFREWRDYTLLPREERDGKTLSAASMEVLSQVLNLIAAADDAVDEAQPILAELMGVPNPDEADDAEADDTGSDDDPPPDTSRAWVPADFTTTASQRLAVLRAGRGR